MHRFSCENTYFIVVTWQKYFLNCNLSDFFPHFFSLVQIESFYSQLDSVVIYWSQYFEIIFHFLDRREQCPHDGRSKRIPNWKTIRRMDEIFLLVGGCIVFHTLPPQWVLSIRLFGFLATRKYFAIYKSLLKLNNMNATTPLHNPHLRRPSTHTHTFSSLSSRRATTLQWCEITKYVCLRLLYENCEHERI